MEQHFVNFSRFLKEKFSEYNNHDDLISKIHERINHLFSLQIDSIKSVSTKKTITGIDTRVWTVIRKYAGFLRKLLLNCHSYHHSKDSILFVRITNLENAVDQAMNITAAGLLNSRNQAIFLINNYDHIISMLQLPKEIEIMNNHQEKRLSTTLSLPHSLSSSSSSSSLLLSSFFWKLKKEYEFKLNSMVNGFVEEELYPYFPELFTLLKKIELNDSSVSEGMYCYHVDSFLLFFFFFAYFRGT